MQITTDTNISSIEYCGTNIPKTLTFDATFVVLKFRSDGSVTRRGFQITYKVSRRKGCQFRIYKRNTQIVSSIVNMMMMMTTTTILLIIVVVAVIIITTTTTTTTIIIIIISTSTTIIITTTKTSYNTCPVASGLLQRRPGRSSSLHTGTVPASPARSDTHRSGSQAAWSCDSSFSRVALTRVTRKRKVYEIWTISCDNSETLRDRMSVTTFH